MTHVFVACIALAAAGGQSLDPSSYVYQPAYALDHALRGPARTYVPQPGDIILAANNDLWSVIGHVLAGSGYPNHSMIVFRKNDGTLGVLEAGPHGKLKQGMVIADVMPHLQDYDAEGRVWVRRRSVPLTEEQSRALSDFAYAQEGKRFAYVRIYSQATPFRSRMPLRAAYFGKPNPAKESFFCSELVINACCAAGLLDPNTARPACTYPRDIFFDHCRNPFVNRSLKEMACGWEPPARWTGCPTIAADSPVISASADHMPIVHTTAKPTPSTSRPQSPYAPIGGRR